MVTESIGACGASGSWSEHARGELELGIRILEFYLGDPPEGCRLHVQLHEHELGTYGTIALTAEPEIGPEGWRYYSMCDRLLPLVHEALLALNSETDEMWYEMDEAELEDGEDVDDGQDTVTSA